MEKLRAFIQGLLEFAVAIITLIVVGVVYAIPTALSIVLAYVVIRWLLAL